MMMEARSISTTMQSPGSGTSGSTPANKYDLQTVVLHEIGHGLGFVSGFGLQYGAFASTVAHDHHDIVVVGMDDGSMRACAERLAELGGGIVVARDGTVVHEGDVLSIDGTSGKVFLGAVPVRPSPVVQYFEGELAPEDGDDLVQAVHRLIGHADAARRLGVQANADTAEDAERARRFVRVRRAHDRERRERRRPGRVRRRRRRLDRRAARHADRSRGAAGSLLADVLVRHLRRRRRPADE